MNYRVLKSKGKYYIQHRETNYHYPPLTILTPFWYLYAHLFNKKLLEPYYTWHIADRCKTYSSLDEAFERIKILSEPDQIFDPIPNGANWVYEGMVKPLENRSI